MKMAYDFHSAGRVSEMAIVDTFTKLIFGAEEKFSASEEHIIQALRLVDTHVEFDSHKDMGQYLRALGVREMIRLVTRVQTCMIDGLQALAQVRNTSVLDRRAH